MTDDRSRDGGDQAPAERLGEAGWEPSDWSACLRHEQHKQLAMAISLVVLAGALLLTGPPGVSDWLTAACLLIIAVETVYSVVSAERREQWERETRERVRVWHALRHHVGIGATDRPLVTDRARHLATWSKVAFVGWPLLGVVFVVGMLDDHVPASLAVPVVLLCLLLVGRAVRRARLARRWLADPLPRVEESPWT